MKKSVLFFESLRASSDSLFQESKTYNLTLDKNLNYKFSKDMLSYLTQVRDDPTFDGVVTVEKLKKDMNQIFGWQAEEIIDLLIFVGAIKNTSKFHIK